MQWPAMQSRMAPHGSEDRWHASCGGIREGVQDREDQETSVQRLKLINQASPAADQGWTLRMEQELSKHANMP